MISTKHEIQPLISALIKFIDLEGNWSLDVIVATCITDPAAAILAVFDRRPEEVLIFFNLRGMKFWLLPSTIVLQIHLHDILVYCLPF
jgi:hypothetical protein